jgi:hypothetical protein
MAKIWSPLTSKTGGKVNCPKCTGKKMGGK